MAGYQAGVSKGERNLSSKTILSKMTDPPDAKRKKTMDKLAQRAAMGDPAALDRLEKLADFDPNDKYGAATQDGRNYARMLFYDLSGTEGSYFTPKDAYIGDDIGKVLSIAAPIAGALIPGVGMLGAGLIGAGGNALGQYAGTGKVNLGQTLMAGGGAAAGNALLGNGLGAGKTGSMFGSAAPGVAPTGPNGWGGDATMGGNAMPGAPAALGKGISVGGILDKGGDLLQKYGPLVAGGLGAISAGKLGSRAEDLRNQAARMALTDYQSRAPLRDAAVTGLTGPQVQRPDLSGLYNDPSNPYRRPVGR